MGDATCDVSGLTTGRRPRTSNSGPHGVGCQIPLSVCRHSIPGNRAPRRDASCTRYVEPSAPPRAAGPRRGPRLDRGFSFNRLSRADRRPDVLALHAGSEHVGWHSRRTAWHSLCSCVRQHCRRVCDPPLRVALHRDHTTGGRIAGIGGSAHLAAAKWLVAVTLSGPSCEVEIPAAGGTADVGDPTQSLRSATPSGRRVWTRNANQQLSTGENPCRYRPRRRAIWTAISW